MLVSKIPHKVAAATANLQEDHTHSLEKIADKLHQKIDDITTGNQQSQQNDGNCSVCNKKGYNTAECLKTYIITVTK